MKIQCFSFLFLCCISFLNAQDAKPQLVAETVVAKTVDNGLRWDQTTHDFGEIAQGKPQTADFVLTNSGTEPLLITNVKSSCGCTAAKHDTNPILPGESTTISATYNAKKSGQFRKTVKVSTNRSETPIVLSVVGTVAAEE